MKRRLEDDLARLAFGDVSPEVAAKLEQSAQLDPDAVKTLATYRTIRDGLKTLGEVPEEQLSKERLREAILSRGIKHEQEVEAPTRWTQWLWLPAMACVAGLVFVNLPKTGPKETQVVAMTDGKTLSKLHVDEGAFRLKPEISSVDKSVANSAVVPPVPAATSAPLPAQANTVALSDSRGSRERTRGTASRHGNRDGFMQAAWERTVQSLVKDGLTANVSFSGSSDYVAMNGSRTAAKKKASGSVAPMSRDAMADKSDTTYVEIGSGQDAETGSRPAQELESTNNDPTSG